LSSADSIENEKLRELYSKRDTAYSMLKELEFDFQSGVLIKEDHRDLEARYKTKAISILKDIDNISKNISKLEKVKKDTGVEEEIEKQVLELRRGKVRFCPQCQTRYQQGDKFCSQCGTNLIQGGTN
jgi:hypothetical protein